MYSNFADGVKFMKYNAVKEPGYTYDSLGNLKRLIMFGFQNFLLLRISWTTMVYMSCPQSNQIYMMDRPVFFNFSTSQEITRYVCLFVLWKFCQIGMGDINSNASRIMPPPQQMEACMKSLPGYICPSYSAPFQVSVWNCAQCCLWECWDNK